MKTTTIEWHNVATDGLPEKSGYYLAYIHNWITDLSYSQKHKAFNAMDWEEVTPEHSMEVDWWAELPKLDEE